MPFEIVRKYNILENPELMKGYKMLKLKDDFMDCFDLDERLVKAEYTLAGNNLYYEPLEEQKTIYTVFDVIDELKELPYNTKLRFAYINNAQRIVEFMLMSEEDATSHTYECGDPKFYLGFFEKDGVTYNLSLVYSGKVKSVTTSWEELRFIRDGRYYKKLLNFKNHCSEENVCDLQTLKEFFEKRISTKLYYKIHKHQPAVNLNEFLQEKVKFQFYTLEQRNEELNLFSNKAYEFVKNCDWADTTFNNCEIEVITKVKKEAYPEKFRWIHGLFNHEYVSIAKIKLEYFESPEEKALFIDDKIFADVPKNKFRIYLGGVGPGHYRPLMYWLQQNVKRRNDSKGNDYIYLNDILSFKGLRGGSNIHNVMDISLNNLLIDGLIAFREVKKLKQAILEDKALISTLSDKQLSNLKEYSVSDNLMTFPKTYWKYIVQYGLNEWIEK